jgi:hypothetical protein
MLYMTKEVAERSGYKGTPVKPPPQVYASSSQQQPQATKAPDMSAYGQSGGQQSGGGYSAYGQQEAPQPRYNASNVPRTPPKGAQKNDLSGNVPSNQIWAQAYNQAAQKTGVPGATSFTMPGSFTSQGYNPTTGQYGQMTGGQSFNGNMAYNAIDSRPSPVMATSTFAGGQPMDFQQSLNQREAFVGNLSQRLGQYSSGQLTGPVTIDQGQLMQQANDQLANGTFYNPFSSQPTGLRSSRPAPERPKAGYETKPPSQWNDEDWAGYNKEQQTGPLRDLIHQPRYYRDQQGRAQYSSGGHFAQAPVEADAAWLGDRTGSGGGVQATSLQNPDFQRAMGNSAQYMQGNFQNPFGPQANVPQPSFNQQSYDPRAEQRQTPAPSSARPIAPPSQGTTYNPQAAAQGLPDVPDAEPSYGEDPIAARKKATKAKAQEDNDLKTLRDRWLSGATTGQSYRKKIGGKIEERTPDEMADQYTGELWQRLNDGRLSQADYDQAVAGMDTDLNQSKARQSKLQQIDGEIAKWERATYGTRKGSGPPPEWSSHIQALKRLRTKAEAGEPAALAWNPKMKAPPSNFTPTARRVAYRL